MKYRVFASLVVGALSSLPVAAQAPAAQANPAAHANSVAAKPAAAMLTVPAGLKFRSRKARRQCLCSLPNSKK